MFPKDDTRTSVQTHNNGVKRSQHHQYQQLPTNNSSAINQTSNYNSGKQQQHQSKSSAFIKFLNPFSSSKSKSQCASEQVKHSDGDQSKSVKVLKQFWNEQIKTAKSSEHLDCADHGNYRKSATLRYFSQSNDNLLDSRYHPSGRAEKSLTLDGSLRLPLDDFNKFKDANFIRNKKIKLLGSAGGECNAHRHQLESSATQQQQQQKRYSRPESLNDNHFPQVSATGGKLHWAKRDDILLAKKSSPAESNSSSSSSTYKHHEQGMSVKANASSTDDGGNGKHLDTPEKNGTAASNKSKSGEQQKQAKSARSDSMTSSVASSISSSSCNTNSASRKFSFKTNPASKKHASNGGGSVSKVAQIAQRFNQMIQQDASILEEVKKRGGVVVHRSGGRVFKIKEEKKKSGTGDDASVISDDAISLVSMGKNSTRRKSTLRKRPSIRIMVESPRKDGNGNVLSKRQLYEANVINKETIVLKPKVPDKSERVLAKTKELKSKKMLLNEISKTEVIAPCAEQLPKIEEVASNSGEPIKDAVSKNNFRKIYDKITFRPTFLYGRKPSKERESTTISAPAEATANNKSNTEATAESNKPYNDDIAINDLEDELEFKPIDLNLNVYFNNENLSNNNASIEEKNVDSQGPPQTTATARDVTTASASANIKEQQQQLDVKPNNSFLFRTQPSGNKLDSACDTFMRGMLNETMAEESIADQGANELQKQENDYEIISKDLQGERAGKSRTVSGGSDGHDDIDKNNEPSDNVSRRDEIADAEENIYQSLCEVKGIVGGSGEHCDAMSDKSYESFENYDEIKQSILDNRINLSDILKCGEDDYIVPESTPPELPAPRKNTVPKISSPILTSTTSNLVQANFPVPKQSYELHKSNSCISTTYEKIKYDQLPQPKQQQHSHTQANAELPLPPRNSRNNNNKLQQHQGSENIYDTIKNYSSGGDSRSISTEYENIPDIDSDESDKNVDKNVKIRRESESLSFADCDDNPYKNSKNDTMSIISNCYESISLKQSYSTINQILRHAISTTTLSSEHRINSIYGIGQSLTPPSDRSGVSDNSDEWIDVESEDETENNDRFIV
jgi:hypothetical protein